MIFLDKYDSCIAVSICQNIDFIAVPGLLKTIYFDLILLRFAQVNYGESILKVPYIGFVPRTIKVTFFA